MCPRRLRSRRGAAAADDDASPVPALSRLPPPPPPNLMVRPWRDLFVETRVQLEATVMAADRFQERDALPTGYMQLHAFVFMADSVTMDISRVFYLTGECTDPDQESAMQRHLQQRAYEASVMAYTPSRTLIVGYARNPLWGALRYEVHVGGAHGFSVEV